MSGILNIVATPIGNLEDITYRAVKTLQESDYIFCEDVRVTKKLLDRYDIKNKALKTYNDHSSSRDRQYILELIKSGSKCSIVSDAGMPLISDPGYKLVRYLQDESVKISVIPGASATLSALTLSGLPTDSFYFGGFLPQKDGQKEKFLEGLINIKSSLIFFDRANRVPSTISKISNVFGEVEVSIVREITKLYEESIRFKASTILSESLNDKLTSLKGEIVVLVDNNKRQIKISDDSLDLELKNLLDKHSVKDASKIASDEFSMPKREAYSKLLEISKNMT
jgi:16S rRNA (cytidine1402-2'-O)-methyltransferase